MKMTILHMSAPKIQVLVTSQMTEGGAQKTMTRMSARARFTMKMLVIDCIDLVDATAENTWKADENIRGVVELRFNALDSRDFTLDGIL